MTLYVLWFENYRAGKYFFRRIKEKKNERKMFYQCSTLFFFSNKAIIYLFAGYDDDSKFAVSRDSN